MIKKLKQFVFALMASSTLVTFGVAPLVASTVAADNITNSVCQGVNNAANGTNGSSCGTAGNSKTDLSSVASTVVNIFSVVVGIIAVIMIIYGGLRYITSGGDSGKVGGAKNSLIYAIVGLIIVALAQIIVHYVLNTAGNAGSNLGS